ncbi:MAG: O-antigen ligase family protein [Eubacteriales bacterium]|nr:O-antigen ligase family protein [Eubacteriales bacterium]
MSNKNRKKMRTQSVSTSMNRICGYLFFAAITMIMPFYYENKYFNMLQAKGHVIQFLVCTLLPITAMIYLLGCAMDYKKKELTAWNWKNCNYMDMALTMFGIATLVSWLGCKDRDTSLWGMKVWCVGAAILVGLVLFYWFSSRSLYLTEYTWIPVGIVNGIIFTISIYHSAGVDLLGMHERIVEKQYYTYISTIGNINWFSGYLCLLVPLFIVLFLNSEKRMLTIFYFIISSLAMVNIVLCASDSVFVGIGSCLFFFVPYMLGKEQRIRRGFLVIATYGISLSIVNFAPCFAAKKETMDGVAASVLSPDIAFPFVGIGVLGYIAVRLWWKKLNEKTIQRIVYIIDGILLITIIGMLIYNISIFDDKWGTKRGLIWKESIRAFGTFDFREKLFGIGPEMLGNCYRGIRDKFTYQVLCAHSEFLQFLLSVGLVGAGSWIAMWIGLLTEYFRRKIWKTDRIVLFLPLAAYMGQSFFNSPMALTISMLFVMLACYRSTEDACKPI